METGTIKKLTDRGFGFIGLTGGLGDVYFHATGLSGGWRFPECREGQAVEFTIVDDNGKPRAVGVRQVIEVAMPAVADPSMSGKEIADEIARLRADIRDGIGSKRELNRQIDALVRQAADLQRQKA